MNVDLLLRVREAILKEPEHFNMSTFFAETIEKPFAGGLIVEDSVDVEAIDRLGNCGTTACIAGWACYLSLDKVDKGSVIIAEAKRLLGLSGEQAGELFFTTSWDDDQVPYFDTWSRRYYTAMTPKEAAEVAAEYILYFIDKET